MCIRMYIHTLYFIYTCTLTLDGLMLYLSFLYTSYMKALVVYVVLWMIRGEWWPMVRWMWEPNSDEFIKHIWARVFGGCMMRDAYISVSCIRLQLGMTLLCSSSFIIASLQELFVSSFPSTSPSRHTSYQLLFALSTLWLTGLRTLPLPSPAILSWTTPKKRFYDCTSMSW